ncbi:MAG: tRNA 2-thiouridine(34) synthase MnmA [Anaplasmataceae bacterium]|nr:tRNA 2-thiouridine(34) synthase MnmA [Anaplasmataceae bacterium]
MSRKSTIFVGMSGGVDSSVAALLLKKQGYNVVGVYMRSYNLDGCADGDARDARRVAEALQIPFYVWDFEEDYKKKVVDYFVGGYASGETPNPDVMCNKEIKFGLFLKKALILGADYIATGHYVRKKGSTLYQAKDLNKDQSYFLWTLKQEEISHTLFPVGDYLKEEIRSFAKKAKLSVANKKDSQGICFLGKVSMEDFLKTQLPEKRGFIIDRSGKKLGEHQGVHFYTIGQRHGLNLKEKNRFANTKGSEQTPPHYVVEKKHQENILIVSHKNDLSLGKRVIHLSHLNYHASNQKEQSVLVRLRYRQPLSSAFLKITSPKKATITLNKEQSFIAPGQSAVFYSSQGTLLGGGVIKAVV